MIMYAVFLILAFMGLILFVYALSIDTGMYQQIGLLIGVPNFMPFTVYYYIGGFFIMLCAIVGIFIRIRMSGCNKRFDKLPKGQGLFNFLYRDGNSLDIYGKRIPGLGFFNIPKLGMLVDTGRNPQPGSVYNFGDKKIRFALQDINYSNNPKFSSFYSYLVDLGFNNMSEVQDVLNGFNAELMVQVWHNILLKGKPQTAGDKLVEQIQTMSKEDVERNNDIMSGLFSKLRRK